MFCKNCGTEIKDTAKFCPKCGNSIKGEEVSKKSIIEDSNIKFQLKPEFNVSYKLITNIWYTIIYTFLICFLLEIYEIFFIYPSTVLVAIAIMMIYVIGKMFFDKMQYKDLEYNFYTTKVEYKDGFLNKEEKQVKYKHIREVTMSKNILERIFNIGTIKIFTNASCGGYNGANHNNMIGKNGIYIHCVNNVEEQYRKIKQIIDEGISEE